MTKINRRGILGIIASFGASVASLFAVWPRGARGNRQEKQPSAVPPDCNESSRCQGSVRALPGKHLMVAIGPGTFATEVVKVVEVRFGGPGEYRHIRHSSEPGDSWVGVPPNYYFQILAQKPDSFPVFENGKISWLRGGVA